MFQTPHMRKMVGILGIMGIIALGAYTYYTLKQAQYMYAGPTTVSVTGKGEVFAKPDVATFTFTVEAKEVDASVAQSKAADTMNAVLAYLKETGVEEKDVKTENYNLVPQYEYPQMPCSQWGYCPPQGEPKLTGYQVNQTVAVKVRDTSKAGEIISKVGEKGAMNVSGLSFTIDDEEALKTEAREKAIADAKDQAKVLADNLGVRIVRMNGYWEEMGGYPTPYGIGGGMDMKVMSASSEAMTAPELPMGENTITVHVNISYEVK
jgi:uncharacterized protein YggE